jgi:hypothetical protein
MRRVVRADRPDFTHLAIERELAQMVSEIDDGVFFTSWKRETEGADVSVVQSDIDDPPIAAFRSETENQAESDGR